MLGRETAAEVIDLAAEAGRLADAAVTRGGSGIGDGRDRSEEGRTIAIADLVASFAFPDELWARIVYDLVLAAGRVDASPEELAAAVSPIYLGRVGGLVVETRRMDAEEAEGRVEAQARAFERLKPSFVEAWRASR